MDKHKARSRRSPLHQTATIIKLIGGGGGQGYEQRAAAIAAGIIIR